MIGVFADTSYYLALLLKNDHAHEQALDVTRRLSSPLVTTAWVLTEVANALASPTSRRLFVRMEAALSDRDDVRVIEPTQTLYLKGIALYRDRLDKGWSLTDCISFVVMGEYGIVDALTADRHFIQAGFHALLTE